MGMKQTAAESALFAQADLSSVAIPRQSQLCSQAVRPENEGKAEFTRKTADAGRVSPRERKCMLPSRYDLLSNNQTSVYA